MAEDQESLSNQPPSERYYTEHVRIYLDEGSDNEVLRARMNQKLQRGWRLVSMIKEPSGDSVKLEWDTSGA